MTDNKLLMKKIPGFTQMIRKSDDIPPDFSTNLSELSGLFLNTLLEMEQLKEPTRKTLDVLLSGAQSDAFPPEIAKEVHRLNDYIAELDTIRTEAELFVVFESSAMALNSCSAMRIAGTVLDKIRHDKKELLSIEKPTEDYTFNGDRAWVEAGLERIILFVLNNAGPVNDGEGYILSLESIDGHVCFHFATPQVKVASKIVDDLEGRGIYALTLPRIIARRHGGTLSIDICKAEVSREFQGYEQDRIVEFQRLESLDIEWRFPP